MKKDIQRKRKYGQFFTPEPLSELILRTVREMAPNICSVPCRIIDPSCGEGVFLNTALKEGMTTPELAHGFDTDTRMNPIWKENGLKDQVKNLKTADGLSLKPAELFDMAIGNPPFGRIRINPADRIYENFILPGEYAKIYRIKQTDFYFPRDILFLEKFLQLIRPGGITAIILSGGILTAGSMDYVRKWILKNHTLLGIMSASAHSFRKQGANATTGILFIRKGKTKPLPSEETLIASGEEIMESLKVKSGGEILRYFRRIPMSALQSAPWNPDFHSGIYDRFFHALESGPYKTSALMNLIDENNICTGYKGPQRKPETAYVIPYITSTHITPAGIYFSGKQSFIDADSPANPERTRLKPGYLLLVRSGEGCIGKSAVVTEEFAGSNIRSEIYVIKPNPEILDPFYLHIFFNCYRAPFRRRNIHFQMARLAGGVGTPNLSKDEILSLRIPLLPMDIQKAIGEEYRNIISDHKNKEESGPTETVLKRLEILINKVENHTGGNTKGWPGHPLNQT